MSESRLAVEAVINAFVHGRRCSPKVFGYRMRTALKMSIAAYLIKESSPQIDANHARDPRLPSVVIGSFDQVCLTADALLPNHVVQRLSIFVLKNKQCGGVVDL